MKKKLLAMVSAVAIALGMVAVTATSASAHHNTISATAACTTDLTYEVTWKIVNSENMEETITSSSNTALVPEGTKIAPKATLTVVQKVDSKQDLSLELGATWTNGNQNTSKGDIKTNAFPKCNPQHTEVTLCHANNGVKGWVEITVDDDAVVKPNGHNSHDDDIIPSFTYWAEVEGVWKQLTYPGKNLDTVYDGKTGAQVLAAGCTTPPQTVTPVVPTVTVIDQCGEYGSIVVPADTAMIDYTHVGNGQTGINTVTAVAKAPYVLTGYPEGGWSFDLGQFYECVTDPKVSFELGACYPNGEFSSKNLYFVFDNSGSNVPVTFTVLDTDISVEVAAGETAEIEGTPIWQNGGEYTVTASGVDEPFIITIPAFEGCQVAEVPAEPGVHPEVCVDGVTTDGAITVDFNPSVVYTITDVDTNEVIPVTGATTPVAAGTYVVSVEAAPGYVLEDDGQWPYTVTVESDEACETTPVAPTVTNQTCSPENEIESGTLTITPVEGVVYSLNGEVLTEVTTELAIGQYDVVATAAEGYELPGGVEQIVYPVTISVEEECELPTFAEVEADASATDELCLSDGSVASGTIVVDEEEHVLYSIDGELVSDAVTEVEPGTYTVTATTDSAEYIIIGDDEWEFTVAAADDCADGGLASTGPENVLPFAGLSALLLLVGAAFIVGRRRVSEES